MAVFHEKQFKPCNHGKQMLKQIWWWYDFNINFVSKNQIAPWSHPAAKKPTRSATDLIVYKPLNLTKVTLQNVTRSGITMDVLSLITSENKVLNHSTNAYRTKKLLPEHSKSLVLACHLVLFERYLLRRQTPFLRN